MLGVPKNIGWVVAAALALVLLATPATAGSGSYAGDVEELGGSLDELVEKYRSDENVSDDLEAFVEEEWEDMEFHEAIEATHPKRYVAIWTAIGKLQEAVERGETPEKVESRAEEVKTALRTGLETLEDGSAEDRASLTGSVEEQAEQLKSRLRHSADEYAAGDGREAVDNVDAAFGAFESSGFRDKVATRDETLYGEIEEAILGVRSSMESGAPAQEVEDRVAEAGGLIDEGAAAASAETSPASLFVNSLVIILREGFEALIVVSAVLAYLTKVGREGMRRSVYLGVGAALGLTALTYVAAQTVLEISGAQREVLEGATMLLATAVLFYVSYWLVSKVQARQWQRFIQGRVEDALSRGSGATLAVLSFAVVYREGFETVLFYQALFFDAETAAGTSAVVAGFLSGAALLAAVYVAFTRYGVRIPTRKFFAVTSAMLYYLAFKFAGEGVRELQEGGVIGETPLGVEVPSALTSWLGVHPYAETVALQAVLVLALMAGVGYVFWLRPRIEVRREATSD